MESVSRFRRMGEFLWSTLDSEKQIPAKDKVVQMEVTEEKTEKLLFPHRNEQEDAVSSELWRSICISALLQPWHFSK